MHLHHRAPALALLLALTTLLVATPADAGTRTKARADNATLAAGQSTMVRVLNNDSIAGPKTKARVKVTKAPAGITSTVKAKAVRLTVAATTAPGAYKVTYQVRDVRRRTATAVLRVTVTRPAAPPTTPPPTGDPSPTPTGDPSPTPTGTTTPTPTGTTLRDRVAALPVATEVRTGYDRDLFTHWNSGAIYGDGCDTRSEVLKAEAVVPVTTGTTCPLTTTRTGGGQWFSYYDNITTTDPSTFDIDHMVPLAESWDSGAHAWTPARREAFANDQTDPRSLVAVSASSNRSKSDQDPAEWLPTHTSATCTYVTDWVAVKTRWSLTVDTAEKNTLTTLANNCPTADVAVTLATN